MDKKYRIKLKNNRIIGPFLIADIGELYIKGRIQGDELCQTFPVGSWKTIRDFDELENLILDIAKNNITLETLRKSLESKPDPIDPNDIPKEFEYQKKTNTKIGYKELKEKFKKNFP